MLPYKPLFMLLECPYVSFKKPSFLVWPSSMVVFTCLLVSYFLITGGVVYDMIVGPPSMGSETDAKGNQRPVAILAWRMNSQYILEGLSASFMFTLGSIGFIVMDRMNEARVTKPNRVILMTFGIACILISFIALRIFMQTKLPSYMK